MPGEPPPAVGSDDPLGGCVDAPEPDEVGTVTGGVAAGLISDGSVSGGNCGCTLQIQAMIWMPGLLTDLSTPVGGPSRENGPMAAEIALAATSLADQSASITRFLIAMNAVGMTANAPVFAGGPEA